MFLLILHCRLKLQKEYTISGLQKGKLRRPLSSLEARKERSCQSYSALHMAWRAECSFHRPTFTGADLGEGCRGCAPPPPEMTCGFLINTVQSASQLYKICFIIWYVFSAVHIMLLPSRKPSSSYSLLKFVYVTSQLRHSLVVHPLLRKILDPPLLYTPWLEVPI